MKSPEPAFHSAIQNRRQFLMTASLLSSQFLAGAQDEPVITTEVKVVNVLATVRDKNGRIIRDLDKADFQLSENGRPQNIRYFARESDLPLVLGLMIDTSMSQEKVLDAERGACFRFLDQVLRETKDKVFIMQFDMGVFLRQELTSSRRALNDTLPFVDTPSHGELQMQTGAGTRLYDAVEKASKDIMMQQTGRKALIILSDGVDTGSETSLASSIEAAQRADAIVYSILFSDAGFYNLPLLGHLSGGDGRGVLMRMSRETGGAFFEVSKKHPIDEAFRLLEEELRSQYNLGFVSDVPVRVSEFRKIQLAVNTKGLTVQSRDRYWARR
jgi:VWFA-related protein